MPEYRKKPVVINAWHIPHEQAARGVAGICTGGAGCPKHGPEDSWPHVHTLEGDHTWTPGDWLIRGVQGEFYFCKPDIFAATYEQAGNGKGIAVIAAERERQMSEEGWTPTHDAQHTDSSLAAAAACYALPEHLRRTRGWREGAPAEWPWSDSWWKPTPWDRVRELAKAGALIAAEIDRLTNEAP